MINGIKIVTPGSKLNSNTKVQALETSLVQSCSNFKDLVLEFERILLELECTKSQILVQKEKCENQTCAGSEALKKVIDVKDNIIQSIANILTELNDTKNLNIISDGLRIISGNQSPLTPPNSAGESFIKLEPANKVKDEHDQSNELRFTAEINIPSRRKSPIISSKKMRNTSGASIDSAKVQEKKKCPETWSTPERKTLKMTFPTPTNCKANGKFRQARLQLTKAKTTSVVDLTNCSDLTDDVECDKLENFKKEAIENDDTILPSPTSGPINFTTIYKSISKNSPRKVKKSLPVLKLKTEAIPHNKENSSVDKEIHTTSKGGNILKESNGCESSPKKKPMLVSKVEAESGTFFLNNENMNQEKDIEKSIDILKDFRCRYPSRPLKQSSSPKKCNEVSRECGDESMSILQQMNRLDDAVCHPCSPSKRPSLRKYVQETEDSKVLKPEPTRVEVQTRTKSDLVEPVFKEPTVRKKLDKQALPGWSCEECKQFYEVLYKDEPAALRSAVCSCSRHRARSDPVRPRTPPGFWQPRWHVPTDTDEFNRLNDAM